MMFDIIANCLIFRTENSAGITQYITPVAGGSYKFSAKFKLLNQDSDKLWHKVEILIHEIFPSGKQSILYF